MKISFGLDNTSMMIEFAGKVISKKNRHIIIKKGGKALIIPDNTVQEWYEEKHWEANVALAGKQLPIFTGDVQTKITFYTDNRSDIDNMITTVFDLLQRVKIIENDKQIKAVSAEKTERINNEYITIVEIFEIQK